MTQRRDERVEQSRTRLMGNAAACGVLMLTNLFAPAALADDFICYSKADVNCDWIVDGQDLSMLLGAWGTGNRALDVDGNCSVGGGEPAGGRTTTRSSAMPSPPSFVRPFDRAHRSPSGRGRRPLSDYKE